MASLRLLLATHRAGVDSYFRNLPTDEHADLAVHQLPLDTGAVRRASAPDHVAVAVVDVDGDQDAAVRIIEHLRSRRRELPVVALLCCSHAMTPAALRALSEVGVEAMLDLHATPAQTWETISAAARGDVVIQLRVARGAGSLHRILTGGDAESEPRVRLSGTDKKVLYLLSEGLSDREMGHRLFLSPHTVKHRVEQLRQKVGARNRIALAAWAGRHGLSSADGDSRARARVTGAAR